MFVSVVIAIYNEKNNIKPLTRRLFSSLKKAGCQFEIIYIIDGTDGSYKISKSVGRQYTNFKIDHSYTKRGFKNSFVKGYSMVDRRCTHILTMDADLNHQPEEIPQMINIMRDEHPDIIIGSRYVSNGTVEKISLSKRIISKLSNKIMAIFWDIKAKDKTSGFRMYKRRLFEECLKKTKSQNFEFLFEILIIASRKKINIKEMSIHFKARTFEKSKFNFMKVSVGYAKILLRSLFQQQ